ncbi:MAG: trk/ktr system potassium uptake protein [Solirubrobacteraceae bacterium]|jgi:trk system potassium uptake protein TrkA|nr:trk/ktr system potassium uptake protein [Solirubrobacteraceae bacterium]MDX6671224.1 trk/ktr system potassium uptake protein [Solirubrobacteraceae bacterium]
MKIVIVGAGRVGSAVALWALGEGNEVSVLDEDPLSQERLSPDGNRSWEDVGGQFTVGTALEVDALEEAGMAGADVCILCTDGDNTNLVVAQIAQKRFDVAKVIVRVLDPYRAEWYREQGLHTICPTKVAIEMLEEAVVSA